jgi:heme exporter protein D
MDVTNHFGFIAAAYVAAALVVGGLSAWVMLDYRVQRRSLIDLDKKGVNRRSAPAHSRPTLEEAEKKA